MMLDLESPVPLPKTMADARTAFLGLGSSTLSGIKLRGILGATYAGMYRALTARGLYRLLSTPADAELVMEVSFAMIDQHVGGDQLLLSLAVYDRATRAVLWTFVEPVQGAFREASFFHHIETAAKTIADDLASVARGELPT